MGRSIHSREKGKLGTMQGDLLNLLPVGKDLDKEDSVPDRGVPHTSDSERTTKFKER